MKLGVMTRSVISLAPSDAMLKTARLMMQYGVSGFPVLDRGELVGVITQGDFLRRAEIGERRMHQAVVEPRNGDTMDNDPSRLQQLTRAQTR